MGDLPPSKIHARDDMSGQIEKNYRWINTTLSVVIAGALAVVGGTWFFRNLDSFKKSTKEWFTADSAKMEWKAPVFPNTSFNTKDMWKGVVLDDQAMKRMREIVVTPPKINIPYTYQPQINIPTYRPPPIPTFRH
jgi:hypothetical protein